MAKTIRLGFIGLDTSHSVNFTRLINDAGHPNHVPGARVVAAYPGGTPDWELSWSRVDGFAKQMHDESGVTICDSPEMVAEQVDVILITAADGRAHRTLFEQLARFGKPTFIDKPMATSLADAHAIVDMARDRNIPLMSCSNARYTPALTAALNEQAPGQIVGVDIFGPMGLQETQPGLFWYGCHSIEMMVKVMGCGCDKVQAVVTDDMEIFTMTWADGRLASFRGSRAGHKRWGVTLHRMEDVQHLMVEKDHMLRYSAMLKAIVTGLAAGRSDVPTDQMLEVVRVMEMGNAARA